MNLILFSSSFIFQLVGHRMGDYLFQTDWQAQNKSKNAWARLKHCLIYSLIVSALLLFAFNWRTALFVFILTLLEHFIIDSRKPIVAWKTFLEKVLARQKGFDIKDLPFFVMIEIDQTVHYMRILILSLLIAHGLL